MQWPTKKTVGRCGDMGPPAEQNLVLHLQDDGDVVVAVTGAGMSGRVYTSTVEFCALGAGGGRSARTREALIALMVAIEADNADAPSAAWPDACRVTPNVRVEPHAEGGSARTTC